MDFASKMNSFSTGLFSFKDRVFRADHSDLCIEGVPQKIEIVNDATGGRLTFVLLRTLFAPSSVGERAEVSGWLYRPIIRMDDPLYIEIFND